jgi:DNA-binding CsgD family transcriptional regulator
MHQAVTAGLERGMRVYRRYDWTRQLDEILEQGYQLGPLERKKAVDRVSALTGWPRQVCWDRARKLGLSRHRPAPVRRWAAKEEEYLLSFLGSKSIRQIARRLGRSESAIRTKLKFLSRAGRTLSARVSDGHTKVELARYLHRSVRTVQNWIDQGRLKARYEGKERTDDTLRVTDEDFRFFWSKHPWEVPLYTLDYEGLEWFCSVMLDVTMNQVMGDPLARRERRRQKKLANAQGLQSAPTAHLSIPHDERLEFSQASEK